tara:strand:+ start:64 stop:480 length:417 start_codon:yes stop_codon:yes gene_type:complete
MKDKINIRKIEVKDYKYINEWWVKQGFKPPGTLILPMDGFGGLIIEKEEPIAAAYIYLTNSKMGYIDNLISNPHYLRKDRFDIIIHLIKACENVARDQGCIEIWATSKYPGIIERCQALGYKTTEANNALIFANNEQQ